MVQPQAHVDSALQWDMTGGDAVGPGGQGSLGASSHGSLRLPHELSSNEVVHRLYTDNHQLREALRRSNMALRDRCEEMESWQRRCREEREFLSCRFREARALVEKLSSENQALQGQLSPSGASLARPCPSTEPSGAGAQGDRPPNPPGPIEGSTEFLQLLKSHKEKLEDGMRDLRRRNEELEREKQETEKEKECLRSSNMQLQAKLSQIQSSCVVEEAAQRTTSQPGGTDSSTLARLTEQLQATQHRYKELQEKLDCLQKTTVQRDRTEALLKQREKEFAQMAKDSEALKAQVTSLLGELNERQSCLDKSEEERKQVEEKLAVRTDELSCIQREMEQLKKQHSVTVDKLLLQTQNLEAALRTERLILTEEKKKLAQLQHAYTQLFRNYDTKVKNGGEAEDLANRLVEAERALALKQDLIDKLKEEVEQQRGALETIPVLTAQADIYKADFRAEREAREKLNQRKEELQERLQQTMTELERLKNEGTSRARMEEMQQRHLDDFRPTHPRLPPPPVGFPGATVPFSPAQQPSFSRLNVSEELPDYRCPKCQYQAPDMDTLQIHVMDCIQ